MSTDTSLVSTDSILPNKRRMILWEGGVKFGGLMALGTLGYSLVKDREILFGQSPLDTPVVFLWLWLLVGNQVIWFAFGCLFGLAMWYLTRMFRSIFAKH